MVRLIATLAAIIAATPVTASSALVDVICDDRNAMLQRLERTHGAERQGRGMRGFDAILEVWTIPSTGEWTLVQSYANGRSCIVAMGQGWETLTPIPNDPA